MPGQRSPQGGAAARRHKMPRAGRNRRSPPSTAGHRRASRCCAIPPVVPTAGETMAGANPARSAHADRIANLIDHLRRQQVGPRPVEENGYLHGHRTAWVSASRIGARVGPVISPVRRVLMRFWPLSAGFSVETDWSPRFASNWKLMTAGRAGGCSPRMQGLPKTLCFRPSAGQPTSNGAHRNVFRWCFRILPRWLSVPSIRRASVRPLTDKTGAHVAVCSRSSNHTGAVISTDSTTLAFRRGRRSRHSRIWCEPCEGRRHHQGRHSPFAFRHDGDQRNHPEGPDADGGR